MLLQVKKLAKLGILGINRRNANYTLRYNRRHLYPLVDDKYRTKQLAEKAGIGVPKLYGLVEFQAQIRDLAKFLEPLQDFVVKPVHGSEGDGVLIFTGRSKYLYREINGLLLSQDELNHHVSNILSGMYSLGGNPDQALIEYRVKFDPIFESICYLGVPDIRIIVFLGVPVMAMVRLPTRLSGGKSNLHQGAMGVGIDIRTGKTLSATWKNDIVAEHPDTGAPVRGIAIPSWEKLLHLSARCYELTGLGYQGVDIVLDKEQGPLILEINARPGLSIQIANCAGISHRLKMVEQNITSLKNIEQRVAFGKTNFSSPGVC